MKFFFNGKIALGWAILVQVCVHGLFAFGAFLLGGFLGDLALVGVFGSSAYIIGAVGLGGFLFLASGQAFVYGEYLMEHVKAYDMHIGGSSYTQSLKTVRWI